MEYTKEVELIKIAIEEFIEKFAKPITIEEKALHMENVDNMLKSNDDRAISDFLQGNLFDPDSMSEDRINEAADLFSSIMRDVEDIKDLENNSMSLNERLSAIELGEIDLTKEVPNKTMDFER